MSEQTFTPGPWHVLPLSSPAAAEVQEAGSFSIGNSADVNQAVILCSRFPWTERADEMKANARLIAAAPELLEALQMLLRFVDEPAGFSIEMVGDTKKFSAFMNTVRVQEKFAIDQARAAIAKALGDQS